MRPYILQGHERPLNQVKFNREGDLLVTCGKVRMRLMAQWPSGWAPGGDVAALSAEAAVQQGGG